MSDPSEINIFRALDFIRDNAKHYAKAKADRVYLEEFRKTKKAMLMKAAEPDYPSSVAQEREAYRHPEYAELLSGLREAVEAEEVLRWQMVAAQAKIEVWRTIEANRRAEAKTL
ncbi:hypothetical protein CURE108131_23105 [Cupriavidus respiraculi]|uniref:Uncharacterized protein n=1 Tax=Cupriavidus respiraculi TaxID=195930 RepID=A0ABN7YG49_9BURK|nr:hypothetical protein [Cupriavidus respiraculi]CAG9172438.1 hypothetical protein LMG21510_01974 [Cupriavidus respiraculi]